MYFGMYLCYLLMAAAVNGSNEVSQNIGEKEKAAGYVVYASLLGW